MKSITAQEIKRRGISAVDEALSEGPVYVIKGNRPSYVVLSEDRYEELVQMEDEAYLARVKASLEEAKAGEVRRGSAADLIRELDLED